MSLSIPSCDTKQKLELLCRLLLSENMLRCIDSSTLALAPITTLPTRFPSSLFYLASRATVLFNELIDKLTCDLPTLLSFYSKIRTEDPFVESFCSIVERVYLQGRKNINECIRAYVTRNDFMLQEVHGEILGIKQVEINLSSVVGPHTMQGLSKLHGELVIPEYRTKLPPNEPRDQLGKALKAMHNLYSATYPSTRPTSVLYIKGDFESNYPEILACVAALQALGPKVFIVSFDDLVGKNARFENNKFYINPKNHCYKGEDEWYEVSVAYFRTAYRPEHYPSSGHWKFREELEAADCITIPSAVSQLTGLKKAQQAWPSVLSKYIPGREVELQRFFVDQADLGDACDASEALVKAALLCPDDFVLKPQREGGGNNFYGQELLKKLASEDISTGGYILMRKIVSPTALTEVFREGKLHMDECVSEIGFYGVGCWLGKEQILNEDIGYLLRTKSAGVDEGGVSIGASVFDSVMLV